MKRKLPSEEYDNDLRPLKKVYTYKDSILKVFEEYSNTSLSFDQTLEEVFQKCQTRNLLPEGENKKDELISILNEKLQEEGKIWKEGNIYENKIQQNNRDTPSLTSSNPLHTDLLTQTNNTLPFSIDREKSLPQIPQIEEKKIFARLLEKWILIHRSENARIILSLLSKYPTKWFTYDEICRKKKSYFKNKSIVECGIRILFSQKRVKKRKRKRTNSNHNFTVVEFQFCFFDLPNAEIPFLSITYAILLILKFSQKPATRKEMEERIIRMIQENVFILLDKTTLKKSENSLNSRSIGRGMSFLKKDPFFSVKEENINGIKYYSLNNGESGDITKQLSLDVDKEESKEEESEEEEEENGHSRRSRIRKEKKQQVLDIFKKNLGIPFTRQRMKEIVKFHSDDYIQDFFRKGFLVRKGNWETGKPRYFYTYKLSTTKTRNDGFFSFEQEEAGVEKPKNPFQEYIYGLVVEVLEGNNNNNNKPMTTKEIFQKIQSFGKQVSYGGVSVILTKLFQRGKILRRKRRKKTKNKSFPYEYLLRDKNKDIDESFEFCEEEEEGEENEEKQIIKIDYKIYFDAFPLLSDILENNNNTLFREITEKENKGFSTKRIKSKETEKKFIQRSIFRRNLIEEKSNILHLKNMNINYLILPIQNIFTKNNNTVIIYKSFGKSINNNINEESKNLMKNILVKVCSVISQLLGFGIKVFLKQESVFYESNDEVEVRICLTERNFKFCSFGDKKDEEFIFHNLIFFNSFLYNHIGIRKNNLPKKEEVSDFNCMIGRIMCLLVI